MRHTGHANPFGPIEGGWNYDRTEVVQERDLMRLHLVQRSAWETQSVPAPAIDLTGGTSPEDLIEHDIGLSIN